MSTDGRPDPAAKPDQEQGSTARTGERRPAAQRVERVPGARRARLTRVAGTLGDADAEATLRQDESQAEPGDAGAGGPNDARLRRDVPPHY